MRDEIGNRELAFIALGRGRDDDVAQQKTEDRSGAVSLITDPDPGGARFTLRHRGATLRLDGGIPFGPEAVGHDDRTHAHPKNESDEESRQGRGQSVARDELPHLVPGARRVRENGLSREKASEVRRQGVHGLVASRPLLGQGLQGRWRRDLAAVPLILRKADAARPPGSP